MATAPTTPPERRPAIPISVAKPVSVTADDFVRAESDLYFSNIVRDGAFGKFTHNRLPTPIEKQTVIRMNRDTLYSAAVFDLDAGPVTITLPDAGARFMSMQVITEDHCPEVIYKAGAYTLTKERIGTRYACTAVRTLVDPSSPKDLDQVHALQDGIKVNQSNTGRFEVPAWDAVSQGFETPLSYWARRCPIRKTCSEQRASRTGRALDRIGHRLGGNATAEATFPLNVTPTRNDREDNLPSHGSGRFRFSTAIWSIFNISNAEGYFEADSGIPYSLDIIVA